MDYFFPTLTLATLGVVTYNCEAIINYFIKFLLYYPGEGEIFKKVNPKIKVNSYHIRSPEHNFRLNYEKTPFIDLDVSFFINDIEYQDVFIERSEFEKKYGREKIYKLPAYGMGVINDVYYTKNIKKGKLYGFIEMLTDDTIYMFDVEEGIIDLKDIFLRYEEEVFGNEDD